MSDLIHRLADFAAANDFTKTRGALNVGLVITRRAREMGLPLDPEAQLSASGGQVRGLSGRAGDRILSDYGVTRSIGTEVGRTNRGSIEKMRIYLAFLDELAASGPLDLVQVEQFWVDQFVTRFANQPFKLRRDAGLSVQQVVRDLVAQAEDRQREAGGAMVTGTLLQHLIGAKLEAAMEGRMGIRHHGANVSDTKGRGGDFDLGDAAIHVTATPGELLIKKCGENIRSGLRPMIVTTKRGQAVAEGLADQKGLLVAIEIYSVEQFVALNINELGMFSTASVTETLRDIITRYNAIVDDCESDPSLQIAWG